MPSSGRSRDRSTLECASAGVLPLPAKSATTPPTRRRGDAAAQSGARRFGEALRAGEPERANAEIDAALAAGLDATAVQSRVIAPAMRWIGELWERGAISVADEHLATALSHQALTRLYPRLLRRGTGARRMVLVAAVGGEHHTLGLRMTADVFDGAGFDVRFLGADLPETSLTAWVADHRPDVVALGVTMAPSAGTLVRQVQDIHDLDPRIRLVVGGQGVPQILRDVPGLIFAEDTEGLVERVTEALRRPEPLKLPAGLDRVGVVATGDAGQGLWTGRGDTLEARLADATAAAADSAREHARRAFTLEQFAYRDPLTDLWNRRAFEDRYLTAHDSPKPPALLMIDVDRFKSINDAHGHEAGDAALVGVARCITDALRSVDFVARYGGDEFAALLPGAAARDALAAGERVRRLVERELTDPRVSVSVGVSAAVGGDRRLLTLGADRALYDAKAAGRNQVTLAR